ncbi:protein OSB2, chloroplastic [Ziziphus jujuba]|uniref:Protein OSB2, chloroplastic n=1 Tax=Ziziphus jujuba TaxID=326968 RepID=A0ABM4AI05_ZIZJJ|nr:protein OSB2, chloroplastic [Ziziphus jujuba]
MALERAAVAACSTKSSLLFVPQNPLTNSPIPSVSSTSKTNRIRFAQRQLKCSVEYNRDHYNDNNQGAVAVAYPKPAEIPWKKELCNTVHLIGVVGVPVEIRHIPSSGKVLAWTRLAVKKSPTNTSWISLTFWDELAHVAFEHVQKGQQIYVSGRLVSDTVENDEGKQQTYYKVVVQQLNFVEKNFSSVASYDRDSDTLTAGKKLGNNAGNGSDTTEELWQAFFANPLEWWDNRRTKRNPKYPDFKHKDTGEALWIEGRYNPPWVKAQLAILDARMGSFNDQDNRMHANLVPGDSFMPF